MISEFNTLNNRNALHSQLLLINRTVYQFQYSVAYVFVTCLAARHPPLEFPPLPIALQFRGIDPHIQPGSFDAGLQGKSTHTCI